MALDRQDIEKKDFPIGRRGYDPEAVDAHLARLADEVEALQRRSDRRGGDSLAQTASAQVQAIVEAAEQSAAAIEREAEEEADRLRRDARAEAERIEQEAVERGREQVARVSEQTSLMLQRVDAMESELGALVESLRTGANRLTADLSLLEGNLGDLQRAAGREDAAAAAPDRLEELQLGSRRAEESAAPAEAAGAGAAAAQAAGAEPIEAEAPDEHDAGQPAPGEQPLGEDALPAAGDTAAEGPRPEPVAGDEDVEGARLIALNMALNGQSREETDRYLAENFDLADREALLDEVYASVGG